MTIISITTTIITTRINYNFRTIPIAISIKLILSYINYMKHTKYL